jgi:hypothetical protein
MRKSAIARVLCLNVSMRKIRSIVMIAAILVPAIPAVAYNGKWLVVEDTNTQTCYRMTQMPAGQNWVKLGEFNTFRQAGMWTWEHRSTICPHSPVFG